MSETRAHIYDDLEKDLLAIFHQAIDRSDPYERVVQNVRIEEDNLLIAGQRISLNELRKVWVLGSGKASAQMAAAIEQVFQGHYLEGIIVCPEGTSPSIDNLRVMHASHPLPSKTSVRAASAIMATAQKVRGDDLVIYLMSGGSSSLLCAPGRGLTLDSVRETYKVLLNCGAHIHEINCVRRHLSYIKGGHLGKLLADTRVVSLAISDVPGNALNDIGSGPLVCDPTSFADALAVVQKYNVEDSLPSDVTEYLYRGVEGKIPDTPDTTPKAHQFSIVGGGKITAQEASRAANERGYSTWLAESAYSAETNAIAREICSQALAALDGDAPLSTPAALIYFGESYLNVTGNGKGGRNQHLALSACKMIDGAHFISLLSAGTDGQDGPTDAAGAICTGDTAALADQAGLDPSRYLKAHDSFHFFERLGGHIKTGPTNNNVMDLQVALVR